MAAPMMSQILSKITRQVSCWSHLREYFFRQGLFQQLDTFLTSFTIFKFWKKNYVVKVQEMIRWYFFEQNHSSSDLIFICKLKLPFAKVVFCFWKKPIWDSCCVNHVMLSCAHNLTDSRHTKSLTSETQKSSPTYSKHL